MQEKIIKIFENENNCHAYEANEQIYNDYLSKMLKGYNKQTEASNYFENIFAQLDAYAKSNSKVFSQLKHLSYELAGLLSKTGETVKRIATVYSEFISSTNNHYKKIQFQSDENVSGISRKLMDGLNQWSLHLNAHKKFVVDNMASFFHFKKHEYLEISTLITCKSDLNNMYKKKQKELDDKKQKLFDAKNVDRWKVNFSQIPGDFNELLKSFARIKPFMLPDVFL